jgi:hypothetical protein
MYRRHTGDCICGAHMIEDANEGTCLKCGHGIPRITREHAYMRNMIDDSTPLDQPLATSRAVEDHRRGPRTKAPIWDEDKCVVAYRDWEQAFGRPPCSTDWAKPVEPNIHRPAYVTIQKLFGGWDAFRQYVADIPRDQVMAA